MTTPPIKSRRPWQHWYVAVLLFRFEVVGGEGEAVPFVRHEFRLIRAPDDQAAYERAMFLGRSVQGDDYKNVRGETVHWKFLGIHDLVWLLELRPGSDKPRYVTPTDGVCLYQFRVHENEAWEVVPKNDLTPFYDVAANMEAWRRMWSSGPS